MIFCFDEQDILFGRVEPSVAAATEGGHYHCLLAGNDALKGASNIKVKEQRGKRRQDGPSCYYTCCCC